MINPALSLNFDSGCGRDGGQITIKLNEENFFCFLSTLIHCSTVGRRMLSKQPPITSSSPALTTPTIELKAEQIPVLPQATETHPCIVGTGFSCLKKHSCC